MSTTAPFGTWPSTITPGTITTRLWYAAEDLDIARALFINRLDRPDADWDTALLTAQERYGSRLVPVTMPMGAGAEFGDHRRGAHDSASP